MDVADIDDESEPDQSIWEPEMQHVVDTDNIELPKPTVSKFLSVSFKSYSESKNLFLLMIVMLLRGQICLNYCGKYCYSLIKVHLRVARYPVLCEKVPFFKRLSHFSNKCF